MKFSGVSVLTSFSLIIINGDGDLDRLGDFILFFLRTVGEAFLSDKAFGLI